MALPAPVITFLSDYGLVDDFVGICHGVIARLCPRARVIDITHGVERHDVRGGAMILQEALPYLPAGIHLAVVDPDVGGERRAVALRVADGRILVGPDNGLLYLAAEQGGGVLEAVDIAHSEFRLEPVAATFHGRDIFAPVAAALASSVPLTDLGQACDPSCLVTLELPRSRVEDDVLVAQALYIDRFGNVGLNVEHDEIAGLGLQLGRPVTIADATGGLEATYVRTFADVNPGDLLVYEDASRRLSVAVSHGSAADRLGVSVDDELRIRT